MLRKIFPVSFRNLPIPILIIGFFYVLVPSFSYFATASNLNMDPLEFKRVFSTFGPLSLSLNLMAFVLGIGILGVKRWAYVLFLLFNFILIGHGTYLLVVQGIEEKFIWNMIYTLAPFFVIAYFLTKEISTPYLTLIPRGFRKKWRIEIPIGGNVKLEDNTTLRLVTMDISPTGCLAKVEGNVPENSKVTIKLDLDGLDWQAPALWVREDGENIGFRFLISRLSKEAEILDRFLSTKLLPRFTTLQGVEIQYGSKKFSADVINVSERGFYISTSENISVGEHFSFKMKLKGFTFDGIAKVSWVNPEAKFDKPVGFGASYMTISPAFLYQIILWFYETINNFTRRER